MHYRKDIQGLRALAVLFVFIFHLNPSWLPGGFIGVDVFFVISGFLIGGIILNKLQDNSFSFIDFYIGRIRRIVPAYYAMLICGALVGAFIMISTSDTGIIRRELMHAILFNSNHLYSKLNSYFGIQADEYIFKHAWSIAIEMKFYLLMPFLLLFIKRKYLLKFLIVITLGLLGYSIYKTHIVHQPSAYYSLLIRIPEFLIGLIAYLLLPRVGRINKNFSGLTGIIVLICCIFFIDKNTLFPGVYALLPCVATALLLISGTGVINKVISLKPFETVGAWSYSIYLWHWPIIALTRYYYDADTFNFIQVLWIISATLVCSLLSYYFIENYFRKNNFKVLTIGTLTSLVALAGCFYGLIIINETVNQIPKEYCGPSIGLKSHNTDVVETMGDPESGSPQIFLTGNSNALSLKPYLDYIGKRNHFSFTTITSNTYMPISGLNIEEVKKKYYNDYKIAKELIPATNREIKKSKIIFLVMSSWKLVPSLPQAVEKLAAGLNDGQHLVIIGTFPSLSKNPIKANRGGVKNNNIRQEYKLRYRQTPKEILQLTKKYKNVHFYDVAVSAVFKEVPFHHDTIMYYDRKHLNDFGSTVLAKDDEKRFMKFLNSIRK
ncbi:acyltransferase family protein [Flavobacterium sp. RHBU_24]|uniref:acyltransferase family protein n=1 Tax=Flavobacterium sp. RHBU_24 TaxID=3391185 RepID=UPI0039848C0C